MRNMYFSEAVADAIRFEMEKDPTVFCIGEDVGFVDGSMGATRGLYKQFGKERVRDTPVAEQMIVGLSAGAALTGMRPVAELMYNDFMGCCMDQIMNQTAKFRYMYGGGMNVPMTLRLTSGGGMQCAAQHSQSLEAMLVHIPGLKVVYPSTPQDVYGLLLTAIEDDNPVMVFEHQMLYQTKGDVVDKDVYSPIPLGSADIKKPGSDVTLVATGLCVLKALEAAEELEKEGISAEVIDPRTLYPFDKELVYKSISKTRKLVIVTEEVKRGAWSGELAANVVEDMFETLDKGVVRVGALNIPCPYTVSLEDYYFPQKNDIISAVKKIME
jgi:pyruvate/2-oxoglutarate/acetoin dehydrogenase E1 component